MEKLIISVGITGSRITRQQTPYIPISPQEIAQSGIEAWKAGASVLHIHVRDLKTGLGTQDYSIFKEVVDRIRSETDAILCLTTSGIPGRNLQFEERLVPLSLNPESVSFDAGSINMRENVFLNPPEFLEMLAKETVAKGIKPELEVFEVGMVEVCNRFLEKGHLKPPLHFQFVLGVLGGMPATAKSLLHLSEILPQGSTWSVIGIGSGSAPHGDDGSGDGRSCPGWFGGQHLLFKGRPGKEQCSIGGESGQGCKRVWKRHCYSTGIQKNPEPVVTKAYQESPMKFIIESF